MANNISIREFIKNFDAGLYAAPDRNVQISAGWYDWFCKDTSLANKTAKLAVKLKQIANSPLINQDTMYVWFKNNCPLNGRLYDDFRIADLATGNPLYCIIPSSGHASIKGQASVWDIKEQKEVVVGNWSDVKQYFNGSASKSSKAAPTEQQSSVVN